MIAASANLRNFLTGFEAHKPRPIRLTDAQCLALLRAALATTFPTCSSIDGEPRAKR